MIEETTESLQSQNDSTIQKDKFKRNRYVPNFIPKSERIFAAIVAFVALIYGGIGVWNDDLILIGQRSHIVHLHGLPAWIAYSSFIAFAISMLTAIVDHYDKRNNESYYASFGFRMLKLFALLFVFAIVLDLYLVHFSH